MFRPRPPPQQVSAEQSINSPTRQPANLTGDFGRLTRRTPHGSRYPTDPVARRWIRGPLSFHVPSTAYVGESQRAYPTLLNPRGNGNTATEEGIHRSRPASQLVTDAVEPRRVTVSVHFAHKASACHASRNYHGPILSLLLQIIHPHERGGKTMPKRKGQLDDSSRHLLRTP